MNAKCGHDFHGMWTQISQSCQNPLQVAGVRRVQTLGLGVMLRHGLLSTQITLNSSHFMHERWKGSQSSPPPWPANSETKEKQDTQARQKRSAETTIHLKTHTHTHTHPCRKRSWGGGHCRAADAASWGFSVSKTAWRLDNIRLQITAQGKPVEDMVKSLFTIGTPSTQEFVQHKGCSRADPWLPYATTESATKQHTERPICLSTDLHGGGKHLGGQC